MGSGCWGKAPWVVSRVGWHVPLDKGGVGLDYMAVR